MTKARDYKREWQLRKEYDSTPRKKAQRAAAGRARYKMEKKHGKTALTGKDVDHKSMNPHDNSDSNLRIRSVKANRGWRKGKKGYNKH